MRTKLWAYAIGAVFGGVAGAYYGSFIGSVFPTSFFFNISVLVLCMVIVGGMGNIYGVMCGAILLEYLNLKGLEKLGIRINDVLDAVGSSKTVDIPKYNFLFFGILLVVMMLVRPGGLIPSERRKAEFEEGGEEHLLYESAAAMSEAAANRLACPAARGGAGAQGVRRPRRRERRRLRHPARVDRQPDRPERRRQDDLLQHPDRRLQADRRAGSSSGTRTSPRSPRTRSRRSAWRGRSRTSASSTT